MRVRVRPVTALLALAFSGAAWLTAQVAPVYQVVVDSDPVALDVAITDSNGRAAADLSKDEFAVLEDGEAQEILDIEPVGVPYSVLLLIDRSSRDKASQWPELILDSVDLFFRTLRAPDRLAVAAFDTRVAVLVDWRRSRNGTVQRLLLRPSEQDTRFFEAVNWAADEMEFVGSSGIPSQPGRMKGRRGVVVFTDGRDREMYPELVRVGGRNVYDPAYKVPASVDARFRRSLRMVESTGVPFYFVAVDTDRQLSEKSAAAKLEGWVRFLGEVRTRMEQLAEASGGRSTYPQRAEDLLPFYQQIRQDLGTGYHISYKSKRPADGKTRRIEVRLRNPALQVYQSRDSYLAR